MSRFRAAGVVLAASMLLAGAAEARPSACPAGLKSQTTALLFFGAGIPGGGEISDADWTGFLDKEVTPRFPDGLTTWDADGRWMTPAGKQTHEKSRVLLLIISGKKSENARLEAVRDAFKRQFHQLSVGLAEHSDCVSF